jgi:hypothetical protein
MPAVTTRTWAKRATLLGLLLIVGSFLAALVAMQDAFTVIASPDPTNKAQLLADAMVKAGRIKQLTRFTSPLGATLFVGGLGALAFFRLRGSPAARPSGSGDNTDDEDDGLDDQDGERGS